MNLRILSSRETEKWLNFNEKTDLVFLGLGPDEI